MAIQEIHENDAVTSELKTIEQISLYYAMKHCYAVFTLVERPDEVLVVQYLFEPWKMKKPYTGTDTAWLMNKDEYEKFGRDRQEEEKKLYGKTDEELESAYRKVKSYRGGRSAFVGVKPDKKKVKKKIKEAK